MTGSSPPVCAMASTSVIFRQTIRFMLPKAPSTTISIKDTNKASNLFCGTLAGTDDAALGVRQANRRIAVCLLLSPYVE